MFNNYYSIVSKAKYQAKHEEGLKILVPKQMFQRFQIVLARAETGKVSEKLLHKIRRIIYYLNWAKEITKKVYNNIMN